MEKTILYSDERIFVLFKIRTGRVVVTYMPRDTYQLEM